MEDSKQIHKIGWKIYQTAKPIFFGKDESDGARRACARLRAIAASGKMSTDVVNEMLPYLDEIERSGLNSQTREAFEKWYMGRFANSVIMQCNLTKVIAFGAIGMVGGFSAMRIVTDAKPHTFSTYAGVAGIVVFGAFCTWLTVKLALKKPKQMLLKYLGPQCRDKK